MKTCIFAPGVVDPLVTSEKNTSIRGIRRRGVVIRTETLVTVDDDYTVREGPFLRSRSITGFNDNGGVISVRLNCETSLVLTDGSDDVRR